VSDLVEFLQARLDGIEQAVHIARQDPERVLREVAADRALLAAYLNPDPQQGPEYGFGLYLALMFRASVWRDHPDYDPEWAPTPPEQPSASPETATPCPEL
jgi:hypothetical protein